VTGLPQPGETFRSCRATFTVLVSPLGLFKCVSDVPNAIPFEVTRKAAARYFAAGDWSR
jgi:hypothetical protein